MKKRRIKGIQMIPYGLLAGVMTEDSIEERQREVRLTEISSEGFRIRLCRRGKAEENIYPKAFKICSVSNIADTFRSSWKRMMNIWCKK